MDADGRKNIRIGGRHGRTVLACTARKVAGTLTPYFSVQERALVAPSRPPLPD
jgi:hypothetical protein